MLDSKTVALFIVGHYCVSNCVKLGFSLRHARARALTRCPACGSYRVVSILPMTWRNGDHDGSQIRFIASAVLHDQKPLELPKGTQTLHCNFEVV